MKQPVSYPELDALREVMSHVDKEVIKFDLRNNERRFLAKTDIPMSFKKFKEMSNKLGIKATLVLELEKDPSIKFKVDLNNNTYESL